MATSLLFKKQQFDYVKDEPSYWIPCCMQCDRPFHWWPLAFDEKPDACFCSMECVTEFAEEWKAENEEEYPE